MQKVIEPPVLLSRILIFVLSTAIVVLLTMVLLLTKMVPLEKPEVFFLHTPRRIDNDIVIVPFNPNNINQIKEYKLGFIKEYVKARNTILDNPEITRQNWQSTLKIWSSNNVYKDFKNTFLYNLYNELIFYPTSLPTMTCEVDFPTNNVARAIIQKNENTYIVSFKWICTANNTRERHEENHKVEIQIKSELDVSDSKNILTKLDKLRNNPLGIQVVKYGSLNGMDPLNSDPSSW